MLQQTQVTYHSFGQAPVTQQFMLGGIVFTLLIIEAVELLDGSNLGFAGFDQQRGAGAIDVRQAQYHQHRHQGNRHTQAQDVPFEAHQHAPVMEKIDGLLFH